MACPPQLKLNGDHRIVQVPWSIARCPECSKSLYVDVNAWDPDTGLPNKIGIEIGCEAVAMFDEPVTAWNGHEFGRKDWQPVEDAVYRWLEVVQ